MSQQDRYYPPAWCRLSPAEHLCAGGCWGITYGQVAEKGESYCRTCDSYCPPLHEVGENYTTPEASAVRDARKET